MAGNYFWVGDENCPLKWRSPIFLPRCANCLTLEITDVRVQRLQDISYEDAIAEGVECDEIGHYANYLDRADDAVIGNWLCPQSSYSTLWNSLHGVNAWRENPWV